MNVHNCMRALFTVVDNMVEVVSQPSLTFPVLLHLIQCSNEEGAREGLTSPKRDPCSSESNPCASF